MIISVIDRSPLPPREDLAAALEREFGGRAVAFADGEPPGAAARFRMTIDPADGPHFEVWGTERGSLDLDGTALQNARAAAAIATLLPSTASRVIAIEPDRGAFVDLVPGITTDEIETDWRDISEGGF